MVVSLFGDQITTFSEIKKRQGYWLDRANREPISISNRGRQYVLLNRSEARNIYITQDYADRLIRFCSEVSIGSKRGAFRSDVFPWASNLSADERIDFCAELVVAFRGAIKNGKWAALEEMVSSWQATAEALTNPEMVELLNTNLDSEEFVTVE